MAKMIYVCGTTLRDDDPDDSWLLLSRREFDVDLDSSHLLGLARMVRDFLTILDAYSVDGALMAKLRCACGRIITTSGEIPNRLEWKIISDVDFDEFEGIVDAEDVYLRCKSIFRCPECGRLWIYWDGFGEAPVCYAPEPY